MVDVFDNGIDASEGFNQTLSNNTDRSSLFNETNATTVPPAGGKPGGGIQMKSRLTETQQDAIAWSRRITAPLSILGSIAIIVMILRRKNKKQKGSYNRLMLGVCFSDIVFSILLLISKFTIPANFPVPGASGNTATCTAHGFFMQWSSLTAPFYNVALLFYFLMLVRYNRKEEEFAKRYESWIHGTVILVPLATAISGLPLTLYNPVPFAGLSCYIAAYPPNCDTNPNMTCTRGMLAQYFYPVYGIFSIYFAMLCLYILLAMIVWTVIQKERESRKFRGRHQEAMLKFTRPVMMQSIMYAVVFSATYLFLSLTRSVGYYGSENINFFAVAIMTGIALPLQGFINFLIFIRPRYMTFRNDCELSRWQSFWKSLSNELIVDAKRTSSIQRRLTNSKFSSARSHDGQSKFVSDCISVDGAASRRDSGDHASANTSLRRGSGDSISFEENFA